MQAAVRASEDDPNDPCTIAGANVRLSGRSSMSPIFRDEFFVGAGTQDAIRASFPFLVDCPGVEVGQVRIRVEFDGGFRVGSGGSMVFRTERGTIFNPESGAVVQEFDAELLALIEDPINAAIPDILGVALPGLVIPCDVLSSTADERCLRQTRAPVSMATGISPEAFSSWNLQCISTANGGLCGFVPSASRVHQRPEGVEVVLAEDDTDPLLSLYDSAGACDRREADADRVGPGDGDAGVVVPGDGRAAGVTAVAHRAVSIEIAVSSEDAT